MKTRHVIADDLGYDEAQTRFSDFSLRFDRTEFEEMVLRETICLVNEHFGWFHSEVATKYRRHFPAPFCTKSYCFLVDLVKEDVYRVVKNDFIIKFCTQVWSKSFLYVDFNVNDMLLL